MQSFRLLALLGLLVSSAASFAAPMSVTVDPPRVRLEGPNARWSLLVTGKNEQGRQHDLTTQSRFTSRSPSIVAVDSTGTVRAISDGTADIEIETAGVKNRVSVVVSGSTSARVFHFETDIIPIFGRHNCSSAGCHGKAEGQGGFRLSVFGSDPLADHTALIREGRGRRIFPSAADASLLLLKASGKVPHGGGTRITSNSEDYATLREWIAAGTPVGSEETPRITELRVEPSERVLDMRSSQKLRVIARFSDGRTADVTHHARFQVNNETVASVSPDGVVTIRDVPGEAAVMAAYLGEVSLFRTLVPRPGNAVTHSVPRFSRIDELVDAKLKKLNITPSEVCTDAEFLRRVFLDLTGTLPSVEETRKFLSNSSQDKRARLVDELLTRPAFADLWALRWADLLRIDRQTLGHQKAYAFYKWVRDSATSNKPLDRFARELVTAEGPLPESGPANFYKAVPKPGEMASTLSQVLLGVRITCAECHHHPYDRWGQDDYYGMVAFFAPITARGNAANGEMLVSTGDPKTKNPRSGSDVLAHALGVESPGANPIGDRRIVLADWMTKPDNPYFARNMANRMWAWLLGRGLIEPVDDIRATNPPSNPELMEELAGFLVRSQYDARAFIRYVTSSRTYQLRSHPNSTNESDGQNYSRALLKRPDAEVLLDMICQTTGVPEKFSGSPTATRAVQLWDSKARHEFLKLFGRPARVTPCECERGKEPSVAQVLNLLNSPDVQAKLSHESGTVVRLIRTHAKNEHVIEELYLTFFSRFPTEQERKTGVAYLARNPQHRRESAEDLAWAMLNSLEFMFNH